MRWRKGSEEPTEKVTALVILVYKQRYLLCTWFPNVGRWLEAKYPHSGLTSDVSSWLPLSEIPGPEAKQIVINTDEGLPEEWAGKKVLVIEVSE